MDHPNLIKPANTIAVLQNKNLSPRKKFGQNFLIDHHVLDKIIRTADITKDDLVLEIGPGLGTLTERLLIDADEVIAVEIDRDLIPVLEENLQSFDNLTILNADFMELDLTGLLEERQGNHHVKVVANLPYYITTPIIMRLLEGRFPIDSITVMVQKEVAERMEAGPGSKTYGALSLAVQYYAEAKIAANVPPNCFIPRPNVGSAVITLRIRKEKSVEVKDEAYLFAVIRASFLQRRKTLANSLSHAKELGVTRVDVETALTSMGLSAQIRGEKLSLEEFASLSNLLYEKKEGTLS